MRIEKSDIALTLFFQKEYADDEWVQLQGSMKVT